MAPTLIAALALVCLVAAVQLQVRVVGEPYLRRVQCDSAHCRAGNRDEPAAAAQHPPLGRLAERGRNRRRPSHPAHPPIQVRTGA
jgi:hypothetical protein